MKLLTFLLLILPVSPRFSETYPLYDRETAEAKIAPILDALKQGVNTKNVEVFSDYIYFPLNVSGNQVITKEGTLPVATQKILTREELQNRFDEVFTGIVAKLVNCITPQNMNYDKNRGFDAAYGAIWFLDIVYEGSGKRVFALSSVSHNIDATNKWIDQNCQTQ